MKGVRMTPETYYTIRRIQSPCGSRFAVRSKGTSGVCKNEKNRDECGLRRLIWKVNSSRFPDPGIRMCPPSQLAQKTPSGGEIQDCAGLLVSNVLTRWS